jgi:hypothetical protein
MTPVSGSGPVGSRLDIPVGTIDRSSQMMILGTFCGEVYYLIGSEVKAAPVGEFLQGYFIGQVASEVYRRTAWILPASKILMAFSMGVAIGYIGFAGAVANTVVFIIKCYAFVGKKNEDVQITRDSLAEVMDHLRYFRQNCPILYSKWRLILNKAVIEAIESLPDGFTAEDVASIVGRVLGGVTASSEGGFRVFLAIVARTLAIYSSLHALPLIAHGTANNSRKIAEDLAIEMGKIGVSITPAEGLKIDEEIRKAGNAGKQHLDGLYKALERLIPALARLIEAWGKEM